ncbi:MAG: hypothetical protein ACRDXD_13730 [Acidimicrobiia bacterium]
MHALSRIHRSLHPDGVLLDVHPEPENARVEVWEQGRIRPLGGLDGEQDSREIRQARSRLEEAERRGWYVTERQRKFELLVHHRSVDEWLERRAREGATSIIPEGMLETARHLLARGADELVIRERVRAAVLRRGADLPSA